MDAGADTADAAAYRICREWFASGERFAGGGRRSKLHLESANLNPADFSDFLASGVADAVSYTHLDVYKRQILYRADRR